jgi:hypothetical protein
MKRQLQCASLALVLCSLLPSLSRADTVVERPPLDEVIVKSWVGICQESPYGVYKLVIRKNGGGELLIHEGVVRRWQIEHWQLKGSQVYFTLAQNKDVVGQFAIHAVLPVDGDCLAFRTRWLSQVALPERLILLFPEERIASALAAFQISATNSSPGAVQVIP